MKKRLGAASNTFIKPPKRQRFGRSTYKRNVDIGIGDITLAFEGNFEKYKKRKKKKGTVEEETIEYSLDEKDIVDVGDIDSVHKVISDLNMNGKPNEISILLICVSAKRACEVIREFKNDSVHCLKLFSKHMKVEEQADMISDIHKYGSQYSETVAGIGTPQRMLKHFELKNLQADKVKLIIFDMKTDLKNYNCLSHPSTNESIFSLLSTYFSKPSELGMSPKFLFW